jgi:hypothetical protein
MWIRSQNKMFLGEYREVGIMKKSIYGYSLTGDSTELGDYESKERAVRVLDTIQQRLIAGAVRDVIANGTRYSKQFVFQMPQK